MLAGFLTIFYALIILCCQIFNNTTIFKNTLIIPIGLFTVLPLQNLGTYQTTFIYCVLGTIFDAIFNFLPFGFTALFFLFVYAIQKSIIFTYPSQQINVTKRLLVEQLANAIFIFAMFYFMPQQFTIQPLITTIFFSQVFILIASNSSQRIYGKIAAICDNYLKYK